jgi:hypothetical protein
MAKCPKIETLQGSSNGINTIFKTSSSYRPGSVQVFRNGLLGERTLVDGWVELGLKRIQLKEPPELGDILQAYYIPA